LVHQLWHAWLDYPHLVLHQRRTLETREDVMTLKNYVNGAFVPAWNGNVRSFHNPADNSQLGEVADSSIEDVDKAVRAAREAFDNGLWPRTPATERASRLFKLADLIESRAVEFAEMETRNCGKPLRESRFDVADAAACFRYYAGIATKPQGQTF
jgi:betaine-aldehyde dehydrogenase